MNHRKEAEKPDSGWYLKPNLTHWYAGYPGRNLEAQGRLLTVLSISYPVVVRGLALLIVHKII